jgi:heavy metal sensor kinase
MRRPQTPHLAALLRLPHLIRFRLTLWYTSLAAFVLATFVGGVYYAFGQYQPQSYADIVRQVFQQQVEVVYRLSPYPPRGPHTYQDYADYGVTFRDPDAPNRSGYEMLFYSSDGKLLSKAPADSVLNTRAAKKDQQAATRHATPVQTNYRGWRFITIPLSAQGNEVIGQIAVPLAHIEAQVDTLKRILIYVAGVLLAISAVGGWLLAGRALRPIDELTRRAQQISAHDLRQRLNLDQDDELGRMAATFDDMIARLEEAFARQKRFTSDASHELRTPLTVMQADLGLALARPRSAEEYRQTLVSMDEEVSRLSSIVNDLLMLTRLDVDPAGMPHEPVALHELLTGLARHVRAIAAERDIAVSADRLEPVTMVGDPTRLRQLFTNLLDNAVTYTQPGGRVTLRLERTRDSARISISDTGIGIAVADLPRIFERFYRAGEARAQNPHGTGLGLAISHSVVQAHRGEITVQSTPGAGTTFTVLLPVDGRKRLRRIYSRRALAPGVAPVVSSQ